MRRGHPLLADNEDLRAREIGLEFHPYLGFKPRPNQVTYRRHAAHLTRIETDALGFVHTGDAAANPGKPAEFRPKPFRVLFLGGSSMFGLGASRNPETIPARFEKPLRERFPDLEIQVVNAGVPGYGTTQERLYYELYLHAWNFELVVGLDGFNDATNAAGDAKFVPHRQNMLVDDRMYLSWFKPSATAAAFARNLFRFPEPLYSLALVRRGLARISGAGAGNGDAETGRSSGRKHHHPQAAFGFEENLERMSRDLIADGRSAVFALQPHLGSQKRTRTENERKLLAAYPDIEVVNRYLADFAPIYAELDRRHAGRGVRFADLRALFAGEDREIWNNVIHANDLGNAILAQALFDAARDDLDRMMAAHIRRKANAAAPR
jgi:hypothetical protein